MSEPARPARDATPPPAARWTDTLTTVLLVATFVALLVAAIPLAFRASGVLPTSTVLPTIGLGEEGDDPHRIRFDEGDERAADEPRVMLPRPTEPPSAPDGRFGSALRPTPLLDRPTVTAAPTGALSPGDLVRIMDEEQGFTLVVRVQGQPAMGWAKTSDLAVR